MAKHRFASQILHMAIALSWWCFTAKSHNITAILNNFPDYSIQNRLMSQTKIADEVNSRQTLTCLVLPNLAMSSFAGNHTAAALKNALRLLVLLDYFDPQKLHEIDGGTTVTTTLYQTTGDAIGQQGFVNITNFRGGRVAFRSAVPGSGFGSDYTKSVRQIPYNISVLEVTGPIIFPGIFDKSPADATTNLTAVLENAGCKTFASLISSSGMIKIFQESMAKGLTLFAPNDEGFRAKRIPDLNSLSSADLVTLLQYHAVASYDPKDSLKTVHHPIATMASGAAGNYEITISSQGDDVMLHTGLVTSRIARTVLDESPVSIFVVDSVLLPVELFGNAPAPTPAPRSADSPPPPAEASPLAAPSPAPTKTPPEAKTPAPVPVPPVLSPSESPVPSPSADSPNNVADEDQNSQATVRKLSYFPAVILAATAAMIW